VEQDVESIRDTQAASEKRDVGIHGVTGDDDRSLKVSEKRLWGVPGEFSSTV